MYSASFGVKCFKKIISLWWRTYNITSKAKGRKKIMKNIFFLLIPRFHNSVCSWTIQSELAHFRTKHNSSHEYSKTLEVEIHHQNAITRGKKKPCCVIDPCNPSVSKKSFLNINFASLLSLVHHNSDCQPLPSKETLPSYHRFWHFPPYQQLSGTATNLLA